MKTMLAVLLLGSLFACGAGMEPNPDAGLNEILDAGAMDGGPYDAGVPPGCAPDNCWDAGAAEDQHCQSICNVEWESKTLTEQQAQPTWLQDCVAGCVQACTAAEDACCYPIQASQCRTL